MKLVFLLRNKNLPSFHSNFHQYFYIITAVPKLMSAKRKGPRKWSPIKRALGAISVSFEVSESRLAYALVSLVWAVRFLKLSSMPTVYIFMPFKLPV